MHDTEAKKLFSEDFFNDPRVLQGKKLLMEALIEHRNRLKEIREPNAELKQAYDQMLIAFGEQRGGKLWYPYLGSGIGNGALVELKDGSIKYDFIGGIGVHYFGHSHPSIAESLIDSAISNTVMQGHLQQNADTVKLTGILLEISKMDHCFLTTSGAMAVENALKIIFQKKFPACRILAFEKCFMGRSITSAQITDKASFREGLPTTVNVDYIPFYDTNDPEGSTQRAVLALQKFLARYPKQHAVMCFELIQGEGGFYAGSTSFFEALMKILKENDIAILVDEVQTFGRTSQPFAYQHFGLQDYIDVVTIGKLSQVCATLYKSIFKPRPGLLSQTFTASTASIHASIAIIEGLLKGEFFGSEGKIAQISHYFIDKLEKMSIRHPALIHGPFGLGAMIAFTPFNGQSELVSKFSHALFEAGIISFIAGNNPMRIRFLIPVGAITREDIDKAILIIEKTLLQLQKK